MKNHFPLLLILVSIIFSLDISAQTAPFNVMTFNIRYPNPDDGFNYWPNRKELVASMIRYHEADLIGVQEAHRSQLEDIVALAPGLAWYGVSRVDGQRDPEPDSEFSAILYRKDRFEPVDTGTFWLSPNPEEVGSKSWDAAFPRIVSWVQFRDKPSGRTFFHFNTHFDHMGTTARAESAKLIRERAASIAGAAPVILTGDFNCVPTDPPYLVITDADHQAHFKDAIFISEMPHHGPLGTWTNAFQFPGVPDRRIDYVFIKNGVKVLKHAILSDSWSGRLPSDHLPVMARVVVE